MFYFYLILTIFCTQFYSFNYCLDLPEDTHLNIYKYLKQGLKPAHNSLFYTNKKIYNLYLGFYKRDLCLFAYKIISSLDQDLAKESFDYLADILYDKSFNYNQSYFFIKNFLDQKISNFADLFHFNLAENKELGLFKKLIEQITLSKIFIIFYGIETYINIKDAQIATILLIKNKKLYLEYLADMSSCEKIDTDIVIYRNNLKIPLYHILFAIVVGIKDFSFIKSVFLHEYKIKNKPNNYAVSIFHTLVCLHLQGPLMDHVCLNNLSAERLRVKMISLKNENLTNDCELQKYIFNILKLMNLLGLTMNRITKQLLLEYFEGIDNIILQINGFTEHE